jgi:hypothetical protein
MAIGAEIVGREGAGRGAGRHHGYFPIEGHETLEDARRSTEVEPGPGGIAPFPD